MAALCLMMQFATMDHAKYDDVMKALNWHNTGPPKGLISHAVYGMASVVPGSRRPGIKICRMMNKGASVAEIGTAKGPDRTRSHVGGENFSPGYAEVISPISGLMLSASAGAGSLRRRGGP